MKMEFKQTLDKPFLSYDKKIKVKNKWEWNSPDEYASVTITEKETTDGEYFTVVAQVGYSDVEGCPVTDSFERAEQLIPSLLAEAASKERGRLNTATAAIKRQWDKLVGFVDTVVKGKLL